MGQAKINAQRNAKLAEQLNSIDIESLGKHIANAGKEHFPRKVGNCVLYAQLGLRVLKHLGIPAEFVAGDAMFCVNKIDSGFIAHNGGGLKKIAHYCHNGGQFSGHCWNRVGNKIVDFSVIEIPDKAAEMEACDGYPTPVEYDFGNVLVMAAKDSVPENALISSLNTDRMLGKTHYTPQPQMTALARRVLDPEYSDGQQYIDDATEAVLAKLK